MTCNPETTRNVTTTVHDNTSGPRRPRPLLAITAILLLAALIAACGTGGGTTAPSATASPTSPAASIDWRKQPSTKLDVTIDVGKLKRGPDPKVPWYADGVIHDGSQVTPINRGKGDWPYETVQFRVADGAYAVSVNHPDGGEGWTGLIDRQGKVLEQADIQAVSADGSQVAWLEPTKPLSKSSIPVLRDLKTGKVTRGKKRPINRLDGFAGSKLLYTTLVRGGYVEGMALWDPATDTDEEVSPDIANGRLLTDDVMLAGIRLEGDRGWCPDLYSFEQRKPLRKPCSGGSFQAVRNSPYFTWTVRDLGVIVDARTGKAVMHLTATNGMHISYLSGEPGGALFVKVSGVVTSDLGGDDGSTAIVRCSLSGTCELASEIYQPKAGTSKSLVELPL